MTDLNALSSPPSFLESRLQDIQHRDVLDAEESWWKSEGVLISGAIDRALGVLGEYGSERWLREAMILAIWEGTSHRQILDGLEVMERKRAHEMLFQRLAEVAPSKELQDMESEVEQHLRLPPGEKEKFAEPLFRRLAALTAKTLAGIAK